MLNNYVNRYELSEQIDSALNCLDSYRKILTQLKESCDYPEDGLLLTHEEKGKMLLSEISKKIFLGMGNYRGFSASSERYNRPVFSKKKRYKKSIVISSEI